LTPLIDFEPSENWRQASRFTGKRHKKNFPRPRPAGRRPVISVNMWITFLEKDCQRFAALRISRLLQARSDLILPEVANCFVK